MSHHGDSTTDELSLPKQQQMIAELHVPADWFDDGSDAILFSGGGNDIAGEAICIYLDSLEDAGQWPRRGAFMHALGAVDISYRDLIVFRNRYAPGVPIFSHGYNFAVPNVAHPTCLGLLG